MTRIFLLVCGLFIVATCSALLNEDFGRLPACEYPSDSMREAILQCRIKPPRTCRGVPYLPYDHPVWDCWRSH